MSAGRVRQFSQFISTRDQHRNWWPDVYRDACKHWGVEPDPQVLAYHTTYQTVRADLKELTGSA